MLFPQLVSTQKISVALTPFSHSVKNAPLAPGQVCHISESEGYLFIGFSGLWLPAPRWAGMGRGRGRGDAVQSHSWGCRPRGHADPEGGVLPVLPGWFSAVSCLPALGSQLQWGEGRGLWEPTSPSPLSVDPPRARPSPL